MHQDDITNAIHPKRRELRLDLNFDSRQTPICAWQTEQALDSNGLQIWSKSKSPKPKHIKRPAKSKKKSKPQNESERVSEKKKSEKKLKVIKSHRIATEVEEEVCIERVPKTSRIKTMEPEPIKEVKKKQKSLVFKKADSVPKFPPIYLSNFAYLPQSNHASVKRTGKKTPTKGFKLSHHQSNPEQIDIRYSILQRLKQSLKPDPCKIFRTKLMQYL